MRWAKLLISCTLLACTAVPSLAKLPKHKPLKKQKTAPKADVSAQTAPAPAETMVASPADEIAAPPTNNSVPVDVQVNVEAPPTLTPYIAFAWHTPTSSLSHVVGTVSYTKDSDPAQVAAALKALPAGERSLLRWSSQELLLASPSDTITGPDGHSYWGPWLPSGSAAEAAFEDQFMGALQQQGASVDYLVLDTEWNIDTWILTQGQLNAITADPRWTGLAQTFDITQTDDLIGWLNDDSRAFDLAMQVTTGGYLHAAFDTPLTAHFPNAHCSDYGDGVLSPALALQAPDLNGCVQPMALPLHGDTQGPVYYSQVGNIGLPANNQGADFTKPLPVLNWQTSGVRALSEADIPIIPWVCGKTWDQCSLQNSPYYDELIYHLALSGGLVNFNLWNADWDHTQDDAAALDADLAELQLATANAPTLTPISTDPVPYTSSVLVSGAECPSGRRVFRITVAGVAQHDQAVNVVLPGETATTAVTIPAGQCGQWLVR